MGLPDEVIYPLFPFPESAFPIVALWTDWVAVSKRAIWVVDFLPMII